MAVQYRDQEALYLLSLMYSQGWGVPASPELSGLMMERLNGSAYLTDSLNPEAPIAAYWLPLPLARGIHHPALHRSGTVRPIPAQGRHAA